jgi:hypothetical protein
VRRIAVQMMISVRCWGILRRVKKAPIPRNQRPALSDSFQNFQLTLRDYGVSTTKNWHLAIGDSLKIWIYLLMA